MKSLKIVLLIFTLIYGASLQAQEETEESTPREYRTEWGSAYKRTLVTIRQIKKVGFLRPPVLVEAMTVKNLSDSKVYGYVQFTGYDLSAKQVVAKTALINSDELDEVIGFFKSLGDFIKEKPVRQVSYEYQDHDKEMSFGAYYKPQQGEWKLYVEIDPVGEIPHIVFLRSENISEIYMALMNSKTTLQKLFSEEK